MRSLLHLLLVGCIEKKNNKKYRPRPLQPLWVAFKYFLLKDYIMKPRPLSSSRGYTFSLNPHEYKKSALSSSSNKDPLYHLSFKDKSRYQDCLPPLEQILTFQFKGELEIKAFLRLSNPLIPSSLIQKPSLFFPQENTPRNQNFLIHFTNPLPPFGKCRELGNTAEWGEKFRRVCFQTTKLAHYAKESRHSHLSSGLPGCFSFLLDTVTMLNFSHHSSPFCRTYSPTRRSLLR